MITLFFTEGPVDGYASAVGSDSVAFGRFFHGMLRRGIYLPPSQFEAWFVSAAHTSAEIDRTVEAARDAIAELAVPA